MRLLLPLVLAASGASAQELPAKDFPPEAKPANAEALRTYLTGRAFNAKYGPGVVVTTQFSTDGKLKATISTGGVDIGDWRVEEGKLCGTLRRSGAFCNDARFEGETLWLRRINGDVIRYEPQ